MTPPLEDQYPELLKAKVIQPVKTKEPIPSPPGFDSNFITSTTNKKNNVPDDKKHTVDVEGLKSKKVWELAIGPAKTIPMNLIMSYMTGNSLQMIPIMTTLMMLWTPLKSIFVDTNRIFKSYQTETNGDIILQSKLVFIACQVACMSIGIWKLNSMGLIPNSESDWLSWKLPNQFIEKVSIL